MQFKKIPEEHKLPCIYRATSKTTGKSYIGQSILGFHLRKNMHENRAKRSDYPSKFGQALEVLGTDDFDWSLVETIDPRNLVLEEIIDTLNKLEVYYIEKYNSFKDGYNSNKGGGNSSKTNLRIMTPEEREQHIKNRKAHNRKQEHRRVSKRNRSKARRSIPEVKERRAKNREKPERKEKHKVQHYEYMKLRKRTPEWKAKHKIRKAKKVANKIQENLKLED